MKPLYAWTILLVLITHNVHADFQVAAGLSLRKVAGDDLVPDCTCITVTPDNRVVASGPGYIRILEDVDGDGGFDRFRTIVDRPSRGAHGLFVDEEQLLFVGDGGVWKIDDVDSNGTFKGEPSQVLRIKTGGEHDAHAIRKGFDNHWYLICGNGVPDPAQLQNRLQPLIERPRAGVIWRITADWSRREVFAHGFRNAYDFDFGPGKTIDTFDSDGERDVSLPWYRPTRVFRVRHGDDAGWISRSWKRPNTDPQMPQVLAEFGRGSPTGVARYRHGRFPDRFHHGVFVADWTFGRLLFVGDDGRREVIVEPDGTTGFAITDVECTPDGKLVISVGGRGSQGALYLLDAKRPRAGAPQPHPWSTAFQTRGPSEAASRVIALRSAQPINGDVDAANQAIVILRNGRSALRQTDRDSANEDLFEACALLIESVGGLGPGDPKDARGKEQAAAVFDGYRGPSRPKLPKLVHQAATDALVNLITSNQPRLVRDEAVRALAVLEPESGTALAALIDDIARVKSPTAKLHRLIASARLPVRHNDITTEQIVEAMIEIPILVDSSGFNIDRNWAPRLAELHDALQRNDSLLTSRLVTNPKFGHPSHLVWTLRMDPENLERFRVRLLGDPKRRRDPKLARFIAEGNDAIRRSVIKDWLENAETRPAAWLAIANHPNANDVATLTTAYRSLDPAIHAAAAQALQKLGVDPPLPREAAESVKNWLARGEAIFALSPNREKGKQLYIEKSCATCHQGTKTLGPRLEGVSKRFSQSDVLRATVDPNHHIPDRFRAKQVLTSDGQVVVGMKIYESVDGLTLMTAEGKTVRINAPEIEESRPAAKSLMPEGLLEGMSNQQAADLIDYVRSM